MIQNIKKLLLSPLFYLWFIVWAAIILFPRLYFTNSELIIWNLGYKYYITETILTYTIALLFGIFFGSTLYKIKTFSAWNSWVGVVGWFLGILVAGCPACSITLASYIWLASIVSVFPFYGMELKFASILFLLYANYSIIKDLSVCKIKK